MDSFTFSPKATRQLQESGLGQGARLTTRRLEAVVGIVRWAQQVTASQAADAKRWKEAREDIEQLQRHLTQLQKALTSAVDSIDVIARRPAKQYLDVPSPMPLSELMRGRFTTPWSDLLAVRQDLRAVRQSVKAALPEVARRLDPLGRGWYPTGLEKKGRGRPRVHGRPWVAGQVAIILRANRITLAKHRGGIFDRVLKVVLTEVEGAAPIDLMRVLVRASDEASALSIEACQQYVRKAFPRVQ